MNNSIVEKIKKGEIKMKPKIFFVLKGFFVLLAALFCFVLVLFLASFFIFIMAKNGFFDFPRFGLLGLRHLIIGLPWILIMLAFLLIVLLEILLKKFAFAWKKPVVYSLLGIIVFVFLVGGIISQTSLHPNLLRRARQDRLPIFGPTYQEFYRNVVELKGIVIFVGKDVFHLRPDENEVDGSLCQCFVNRQTRIMPRTRIIKIGDRVMVLGRPRYNESDFLLDTIAVRFLNIDLK